MVSRRTCIGIVWDLKTVHASEEKSFFLYSLLIVCTAAQIFSLSQQLRRMTGWVIDAKNVDIRRLEMRRPHAMAWEMMAHRPLRSGYSATTFAPYENSGKTDDWQRTENTIHSLLL